MSLHKRIVFIVLDSADAKWLKRWSSDARLPHLQSLFASSLVGDVRSCPGVYTIATWDTLATGVEPVRHGRYSFALFNSDTYEVARLPAEGNPFMPFWRALDNVGKRVAIIDFPRAALSRLSHGVQIADWYPHDFVYGGLRTWPSHLAQAIDNRYGNDPFNGNCDHWPVNTHAGHTGFIDALLGRIEAKVSCFTRLWRESEWDLACVSFGEAHCGGHRCWHIQHDDHEWHREDLRRASGPPMLRIYQALDSAVGALLKMIGQETTVLLLANPGMGPHYHGFGAMQSALSRINAMMPHGIPRSDNELQSRSTADTRLVASDSAGLRMAEKSFSIPIGNSFYGVRINLVGRERYGRIRPGVEYQAYSRELSQELLALRRVDDRTPVFDACLRTDEVYGDCGTDHPLPDLMFQWNRDRSIQDMESAVVGVVRSGQGRTRSGDHRAVGLYALRDPAGSCGSIDSVRDIDIGPTLSAMLGVDMPEASGIVRRDWLAVADST